MIGILKHESFSSAGPRVAALRDDESGEHAQQRTLPAPIGTEKHEKRTFRHAQGRAFQRLDRLGRRATGELDPELVHVDAPTVARVGRGRERSHGTGRRGARGARAARRMRGARVRAYRCRVCGHGVRCCDARAVLRVELGYNRVPVLSLDEATTRDAC